jgi:hypothetical protein
MQQYAPLVKDLAPEGCHIVHATICTVRQGLASRDVVSCGMTMEIQAELAILYQWVPVKPLASNSSILPRMVRKQEVGERGMTALIRKLWQIASVIIWDASNGIVHDWGI